VKSQEPVIPEEYSPQLHQAIDRLKTLRAEQQDAVVVLVTGVFDVFHSEHAKFLDAAKKLGDILFVAIESDVRVRQLKGEGRPVNSQQQRQATLEKHPAVDMVGILPQQFSKPEDHEQFIATVRPDYLAISQHSPHQDKKAAILRKYGGRLRVVLAHNPNISTTQILQSRSER